MMYLAEIVATAAAGAEVLEAYEVSAKYPFEAARRAAARHFSCENPCDGQLLLVRIAGTVYATRATVCAHYSVAWSNA